MHSSERGTRTPEESLEFFVGTLGTQQDGLPSRHCRPQRKTEDGKVCKEGIKKAQIMRAVTRDDVRTSSQKRIPK